MIEPEIVYGTDGLPRYVCNQCGVRYKALSGLRSHARECGKGAKCPICGFVCTQRRNLPAHIATHSLVKYRCRKPRKSKSICS